MAHGGEHSGDGPPRYTIGFYNLENLFDTQHQPNHQDQDYTPTGRRHWTEQRYRDKLNKLGRTIAHMARKSTPGLPVLLGVAEVENDDVLHDLLSTHGLRDGGLSFFHAESPDKRGIDTALIYHRDFFEPEYFRPEPLLVFDSDGDRDFTRDIACISGKLNGEQVMVLVNHWPSRRAGSQNEASGTEGSAKEGDQATRGKRMIAAEKVVTLVDRARLEDTHQAFIVMGDFNDGPDSRSIRYLSESTGLVNTTEKLLTHDQGSAKYNRTWMLFDQILMSHNFMEPSPRSHRLHGTDIFHPEFLQEWSEPFKGKPFRTYVGPKYLGGYSDHFPVMAHLDFEP